MLSVIIAGVHLSQILDVRRDSSGSTAGNVLGPVVEQEPDQTSGELIRGGMNISPTIEIRPGYASTSW